MRGLGTLHPTDGSPMMSDTVASVIGTTAGAIVAQDYYASTLPTSRPTIMIITATVACWFNDNSTKSTSPSTNTAGTTLSSDRNILIPANTPIRRQIAGDSTGYSFAFPSSGIAVLEFFKRSGPSST